MSLVKHAMSEFEAAGWIDKDGKWLDDMQEAICKNVLAMIKVFADGDHSGSTAPYAISMFEKLAYFKPLGALTGEDSEWCEVQDGTLWQNKRCCRVLKEKDGKAFDIDGKIFEEPDGNRYSGHESQVYITFPYIPKTEIVRVKQRTKCTT